MERAYAAEGDVRETFAFKESEGDGFEKFPVHLPPRKLGGGEDADEHTDNAPKDGGGHETADCFVVVGDFFGHKILKVEDRYLRGLPEGAESKGMRESCSRLLRRDRRDSTAKHTTKIAARQELTRMVTARTFTRLMKQSREKGASRGLR